MHHVDGKQSAFSAAVKYLSNYIKNISCNSAIDILGQIVTK